MFKWKGLPFTLGKMGKNIEENYQVLEILINWGFVGLYRTMARNAEQANEVCVGSWEEL